jgi:predicted nucleic acid-binding protein
MSKGFLDTNVLVYALDRHDRTRRKRSQQLVSDLRRAGGGVTSTQVLQEFFVVATRKLSIDPLEVKPLLQWFEKHFELVVITAPLIREAIDCSVLSKLSFWDALIVIAAESARSATLYTEDLNDGQVIRGVRVSNPYASGK